MTTYLLTDAQVRALLADAISRYAGTVLALGNGSVSGPLPDINPATLAIEAALATLSPEPEAGSDLQQQAEQAAREHLAHDWNAERLRRLGEDPPERRPLLKLRTVALGTAHNVLLKPYEAEFVRLFEAAVRRLVGRSRDRAISVGR